MRKISFQLSKLPFFYMAFVSVLATSCLEKDVYKGIEDDGEVENTANQFDYSTKKSVTINLDYAKTYQIPFEVFYSNPLNESGEKNSNMQPFLKGRTDLNGKFTIQFDDIPAGVTDLYAYSPTLTVPTLLHAKVEGSTVNFIAESQESTLSRAATRASANGDYYTDWNPRTCTYQNPLGSWDGNGNVSYLNQGDNINEYKLDVTDKFTRTITSTLEADNLSYGLFLTHQYIKISEDANVFINFVEHRDTERNNALAYYTLAPGENEPAKHPTDLAIAFPNLAADGLKKGDAIQLKYYDKSANQWTTKFPAGSQVGFVLLVDAFKNADLEKKVNLMYSSKRYNSYTIKKTADGDGSISADRPQMFAFMADGKLVLSFEDMPWHEKRTKGQVAHGDFYDDIFTIATNPIKALPDDVEPGIDPEEEVEETPNTFMSSAGILSFEDNWPKKGDYDLNDVVFSYQRTLNMKNNNGDLSVLSVDEIYTFKNNGATYKNGFGYEIGGNVKRKDVAVTVASDIKCEGQGLDPELEHATVMLVDNTRLVDAGTTFTVHTKFKSRLDYFDLFQNPYNPFIVVMGYNEGRFLDKDRVEIHLPKTYKPTPKADMSKFGTKDDLSSIDKNLYYVCSGDYPFAIEITGKFDTSDIPNFQIPEENKAIDVSYPKFKDWVKNPSNNADWWKK